MGYDRYDTRQGSRGEHDRWSENRRDERSGGRDERGFLDRAGEQISSWFGWDDDERGRRGPERDHGRRDYREVGRDRGWSGNYRHDREQERSQFGERDREEDRNWFGGREPYEERSFRGRDRHEQREHFGPADRMSNSDRSVSRVSRWSGRDRDREQREYRPMTGDYGRSEGFAARDFDHEERERSSRSSFSPRPESNWDRDDYRSTSFAGSRERSHHHDPHYRQWRERQLQELDRDYEEYHRERGSHFENDFGSWRERRQQKRQLLAQVREHMEVTGSDGQHVGTVDKVAGDRIILTKSDPESGGVHHSLGCTDIDRVDGNRVILDCTAEQAKRRWQDEDRSRALFEREDRGEVGPHMLERSFSGTYRD